MDINKLLEIIDVNKIAASIIEDLSDGVLLDTLYFAIKPSIIKALKVSINEIR